MASAGQPPKYISYCEKKVKRPDGVYTLFWIQDTANQDTLAIVVRHLCNLVACELLRPA